MRRQSKGLCTYTTAVTWAWLNYSSKKEEHTTSEDVFSENESVPDVMQNANVMHPKYVYLTLFVIIHPDPENNTMPEYLIQETLNV